MQDTSYLKNPMEPLKLIIAIVLLCTIFYLIVQLRLGNIRCNIGYYPGVQGTVDLDKHLLQDASRLMEKTEGQLKKIRYTMQRAPMTYETIVGKLQSESVNSDNLIDCYTLKDSPKYERGVLLFTNNSMSKCMADNPYCKSSHTVSGKSLLNYRGPDGVYKIRDYIKLANSGGGWMGSYWRDMGGAVSRIYTYVMPIPTRNVFMTSSFNF